VFDWIDADGDKELNYTEMVAYLWDQKGFKGQKGLRAGGWLLRTSTQLDVESANQVRASV